MQEPTIEQKVSAIALTSSVLVDVYLFLKEMRKIDSRGAVLEGRVIESLRSLGYVQTANSLIQ